MAALAVDPIRDKIRRLGDLLAEVEFLELLEGGKIVGFTFLVRKVDGLPEKFSLGGDDGDKVVFRKSLLPKLKEILDVYTEDIKAELKTATTKA